MSNSGYEDSMEKLDCGLFIFSIKEILFTTWKSLSKFWYNRVAKIKDASEPSEVIIEDRVAEKKDANNSGPIFPPEVIIEILMRLPLKSLIQLQLVCKEWQAFIQDHYFVGKHMQQSEVACHFIHYVSPSAVSSSDYEEFSYIQGCDGLLLMQSCVSRKCFLWNPATRGVLELPDPHNCSFRFAFSYVPSTANYRLVSLYLNTEEYGFEVFTPGQSKAWRALKFPDFVKANGPIESFSVVSAGALVHCMLIFEVGNSISQVMVISLDLGTECFTVNPLPRGIFKDWKKVEALDWDGKLAIGDVVGEDLELMVLEDISKKKNRWCENKKKIPLPFMKKKGYGEGDLFPLFAKRGDIWFWLKGEKVFTCTIETGFCIDIAQAKTFGHEEVKLYPYKASLITFEGMQPDTKLEYLRKSISLK